MAKYQLGDLPKSEEFQGFYGKVDALRAGGQLDYITITKENLAANEALLDRVYNDYYMKVFPDPTEREPLERWKEDIQLGLEATNVRVITIFGSNLSDPAQARIASVGASEIYRTAEGEATIFPNYYFSCAKIEEDKDARQATTPPIPLMFALQLSEAQKMSDQMGSTITSAFFEAEEPAKVRASAAQDLSDKGILPLEKATLLVEALAGGRTGREAAISALDPGFQDEARELSVMLRQVEGRDKMYEQVLGKLKVGYYDVPGYGQPDLGEGGPCLVLKGRCIGDAAQASAFADQFFTAFAGKDVKGVAADDPNFRHMADQLAADVAAGVGKKFEIGERTAAVMAKAFEHELDRFVEQSLAVPKSRVERLEKRDALPEGVGNAGASHQGGGA
jgi:hypothetical protein